MLHWPQAHEQLVDAPWDRDAVRAAIREIAADCEAGVRRRAGVAGSRAGQRGGRRGPWATMYLGASGVVYALDLLQRARPRSIRSRDYLPALDRLLEGYRAEPEFGRVGARAELLDGRDRHPARPPAPATLARRRRSASRSWSPRTRATPTASSCGAARARCSPPGGSGGTTSGARAPTRCATPGMTRRALDAGLYGGRGRSTSGLRTGSRAVSRRLRRSPTDELHRRASETFKRFAIEEDGLANWPPGAGEELTPPARGGIRLQWCHGAPGMVACLAGDRSGRRRARAAAARGRRAHLARRPAREGREPLPRDGGQRPRVPGAVSPHGRREVAAAGARIRDARRRAGRARPARARPRPLLAVDRRSRARRSTWRSASRAAARCPASTRPAGRFDVELDACGDG